jgi:hypothetical protein
MREWDWATGGVYTQEHKARIEDHLNKKRKRFDTLGRLIEQTRPYLFQNSIWTHHQVFPSIGKHGFLPTVYGHTMDFVEAWGTEVTAGFSLYLILQALGKMIVWTYYCFALHTTHGCGRMLFWVPCFQALYAKSYRQYKMNRQELRDQKDQEPCSPPDECDKEDDGDSRRMATWEEFKDRPITTKVYPTLPEGPSTESLADPEGILAKIRRTLGMTNPPVPFHTDQENVGGE